MPIVAKKTARLEAEVGHGPRLWQFWFAAWKVGRCGGGGCGVEEGVCVEEGVDLRETI